MDAGDALRQPGARRCWQSQAKRSTGSGSRSTNGRGHAGTAAATTGWLRSVAEPDLISAPARWTGTGWGAKMPLDPLVIPWGQAGEAVAAPTTASSSRAATARRSPRRASRRWRGGIGSRSPAATWWRANLTEWDWRADAISITRPGDQVRGSQGPWTKLDGLLVPEPASDARGPPSVAVTLQTCSGAGDRRTRCGSSTPDRPATATYYRGPGQR